MKSFEMNLGRENQSESNNNDERFNTLVEGLDEEQIRNFVRIIESKGFDTAVFMNTVELHNESNDPAELTGKLEELADITDPDEFKDKALEIIALAKNF